MSRWSCILLVALLVAGATATLQWPDTYTATGQIVLPYAEIDEPFYIAVDIPNKRSLTSTYDGMAIFFNLGAEGTYGTMYKIVPETTKDFANKKTCFKVPGMNGAEVMPQTILPNASLYSYVTDYKYNGKMTALYLSSFVEGTKMNNYTLLVDKVTGYPVVLIFTGFDRLLGSHYDKYIILYNTFNTSINASLFNQDFSGCTSFPGPGVTVPMAENPVFPFVGADGVPCKHQSHKVDTEFEKFKEKHVRKYSGDKEEELRKFYFRHNHRFIESTNRRNLTYKVKVNHLSDLSDKEIHMMRGYRTSKNSPRGELYTPKTKVEDMPEYYNWRMRGAVTPVKDQAICGSCWSFGTTGTIEGSYFIKYKMLVPMSEQALVDCSWGYGNNGCDGGESERAYQWIIDNGCIPTEASYNGGHYLMQDGYCQVNQSTCGAKLTKFYNTPSGDTNALVQAIYEKGPISIAIDASHKSFSFYSHGIYYEPNCGNGEDDLDHQVLAVGYGTLDNVTGQEFFMVKNSWSTYWGMDGYVLMSRRDNNCGTATDASYADIA